VPVSSDWLLTCSNWNLGAGQMSMKIVAQQFVVSIAGYVSVCVQLYCVAFHCFTTCFGLHGHLQVCRIFYFLVLKESASLLFFLPFVHVVTLCTFSFVFFPLFPSLFLLFLCVCMCLLALSLLFSSEAESFKHMKIEYPTHLKMAT
jgi:hypothetical protein